VGICQRALILQDVLIHANGYLAVVIVIIIIIAAHVFPSIPCFLLPSHLLLLLLPCLLIQFSREAIPRCQGLILRQRNQTVFKG